MENCTNCGKRLMSQAEQEKSKFKDWGDVCDGELTMDVDPFAAEIHDDYTLYEDCEGRRYESAMDI